MKRELTCIICPKGCSLVVDLDSETKVVGNFCKRGYEYGVEECTLPKRTLTSSIEVLNGDKERVSVKTSKRIDKDSLLDVMKVIKKMKVRAPILVGDVLISDVCNKDITVIATSKVNNIK